MDLPTEALHARAARRSMTLRRLLLLGCVALVAGCGGQSAPATRVLFLGNSYTFVNDLPHAFAALAASGGHRAETGMLADPGETLAQHVSSPQTASTLAAGWNVVVLQEQSQIPAVESLRRSQMYPAARSLVGMVRAAGAEPVFFLTWAHRSGWPEEGIPDYLHMQQAVDDGYLTIARELGVAVAPVGYAWWTLLVREPAAFLWQDDGSHPTSEGTYLAACVLYAAIFHESTVGLRFQSDVPPDEAARLQDVADSVVLGRPSVWNLG